MDRIIRAAQDGVRVKIDGKVVWQGLGNRSGLHSFADTLISEKWHKSGSRFIKKLEVLPAGTKVELFRFKNVNRDRGNWIKVSTITL